MKSVAVSQRVDWIGNRHELRDSLDGRLNVFLHDNGFMPHPIPNCPRFLKDGYLQEWLKRISVDAIVLSGGNSIGEHNSRDDLERALIKYATENLTPLLGICRGMQILGDYFGAGLRKVSGHVGVRHELRNCIDRPNLFPESVNSYHNFSLHEIPSVFETTAMGPGGSCEAIRHIQLPIEGWMWHPERENPFCETDLLNIKRVLNND
jgi:N5-(cytidine 5'-diphosphoramidyl)-L-glutamine hydrolase